jgi:hypothetical protein
METLQGEPEDLLISIFRSPLLSGKNLEGVSCKHMKDRCRANSMKKTAAVALIVVALTISSAPAFFSAIIH